MRLVHLLHPNRQRSVCGVPVNNVKTLNGRISGAGIILTLAGKTTCQSCRDTIAWARAARRPIEIDETEHGEHTHPPKAEIGDWWFHPVTGEMKELTEDGWVMHPLPVKEEE